MSNDMQLLGTERYKDGRYGGREYTYYLVGNMIEERTLTGSKDMWVVTRYINVTESDQQRFAALVLVLAQGERKSARGHNELRTILRRYPSISGYVKPDEIDAPDRKVIISSGINMPPDHDLWESYFAPKILEGTQ